MLFVYLYRRFTSQVESFSTVTGKAFRPLLIDLGLWRYFASAVALTLLILMVVLPMMVLALMAFLPYYHVPTWETWQTLTLNNFRYILTSPRVYRAVGNSLFLATVGASLCMFIAALTAYITVRTKLAARGASGSSGFYPLGLSRHSAGPGPPMGLRRLPHPDLRYHLDHYDRLCDALSSLRASRCE